MAQSFESWWGVLGPLTKFALITAFLCTAAVSMGIVSPELMIVDFEKLFYSLELWRLVTSTFLLGKFGFPWLMNLAMLVTYVKNHEEIGFPGRRADMVWMMLVLGAFEQLAAALLGMRLVAFAFVMSLCWIFCKRNPSFSMNIYVFNFSANMFPWALMVFHLVMGMNIIDDIVGIVAGHAFLFAHDVLPVTHNITIITTPKFLLSYFPPEKLGVSGLNQVPQARQAQQQQPARHNWGAGRALGN